VGHVSTRAKVGLAVGGICLTALLTLTIGGRFYCTARHLHTRSLTPTIHYGDLIWTRPTRTVHRGQIVLLVPPPTSNDRPLDRPSLVITRVVALGGEVVSERDGRLQIDGRDAIEPYLAAGTVTSGGTIRTTTLVPRGSIYVIGDNRANTAGSNLYGPVPMANVRERVVWIGAPPMHLLYALSFLAALFYAVVALNIVRGVDELGVSGDPHGAHDVVRSALGRRR
jgi:signal peptidase I